MLSLELRKESSIKIHLAQAQVHMMEKRKSQVLLLSLEEDPKLLRCQMDQAQELMIAQLRQ